MLSLATGGNEIFQRYNELLIATSDISYAVGAREFTAAPINDRLSFGNNGSSRSRIRPRDRTRRNSAINTARVIVRGNSLLFEERKFSEVLEI